MLASLSSAEFGNQLRTERERLCLSLRDVQKLSRSLANQRKNEEYYIAHSSLADMENGLTKPTIFKLYSLSVIYRRRYDQVASMVGIPTSEAENDHNTLSFPKTFLSEALAESAIEWTAAVREKLRAEPTNLVARMLKNWRDIPAGLSGQANPPNFVYGYVGAEDFMLHPFVRPGSIVLIDSHQKKILPVEWHNDFDRPIFFVELRDRYVCCWCELHASQLILIPTPHSHKSALHVRYPFDATIVGRVTALAMTLSDIPGRPRPR